MNNLNKKQKIVLIIIVIFALIVIVSYYIYNESNVFLKQEDMLENISYSEDLKTESEKEKNTIKVHISGAVNNEGIVELEENSRLVDAIEKAGGLKADAYTDEINLAYILEDGEKIHIRTKEEFEKSKQENLDEVNNNDETVENSNVIKNNKKSKININTATQTELETLPGIGKTTALKIINYRKENGKFKNIESIKDVKGIGDSKYEKIKNLICI